MPGEESCLVHEAQEEGGFGASVASMGDLDGDGVTDLVVGAPGVDGHGAIYIFFLTNEMTVKSCVKIGHNDHESFGGFQAKLDVGDLFGTAVADIGDLDGDGCTDVVVGAVGDDDGPRREGPRVDSGALYILYMNKEGMVKHYSKISAAKGNLILGPSAGERFGASIVYLGDPENNGHPEIAVGAPYYKSESLTAALQEEKDNIKEGQGAVYLLELLPNGDVKSFAILSKTRPLANVPLGRTPYEYVEIDIKPGDKFGSALASTDLNLDGFPDLAVGSSGHKEPLSIAVSTDVVEHSASGVVSPGGPGGSLLALPSGPASVINQHPIIKAGLELHEGIQKAVDALTPVVAETVISDEEVDLNKEPEGGLGLLLLGKRETVSKVVEFKADANFPLTPGEEFGASLAYIQGVYPFLLIGAPGEPLGSRGGSVYLYFCIAY